jgi:hypothetical protein
LEKEVLYVPFCAYAYDYFCNGIKISELMDVIKKVWVVFSLEDSICGISNSGLDYDKYSYNLGKSAVFENKHEAEEYIEYTMIDMKKRKVGKGSRFIIVEVYSYFDDEILK